MKRLRAVTKAGDAVLASRSACKSSRPLSTAIDRPYRNPASKTLPSVSAARQSKLQSRLPILARNASSASSASELRKTPLYDLHVQNGAKMVPFGGFYMPVQYDSLSVSASHHFTRSHASLFDVSHMVQHRFSGPGATAFLEKITPASISGLKTHAGGLSTLLLPVTGGIVDDTIITRLGPELFYVVTNAGCREKDLKYFTEELKAYRATSEEKVEWEVLEDWGLVALQGPLSEEILSGLLVNPDEVNLRELFFGQSQYVKIKLADSKISEPLLVSRGGYTGEDGFEISISPEETVEVTKALLRSATPERLQLAGLGARDSLRLEAGMCLYGHDLDETTTPVEAALSWIIGKDRRTEGGFHGAEIILKQLTPKSKGGSGVERRRIGLIVEGAPAREGAEIVGENGEKLGKITSGCPSPTLGKNVAMGYIKDGFHKAGTDVQVLVRGKPRKAQVTKMPFVPSRYWKGQASS